MSSETSPTGSVRGLLLAAGRGERLRPLTDTVPKPALPVLDIPLGAWGLTALARATGPVVVNASHGAETVARALQVDRPGGREDAHLMLERPEAFGTGGTLRALRDQVVDRLVVWNSDSLTDVDLDALLDAHSAAGVAATVAVAPATEEGDFELNDGRVVRLIDRRSEDRLGARFIGVTVYERRALDLLPDRVPLGATEGLLVPLIERGELHAFEHAGYALDVGTPQRYLTANKDVLAGTAPAPPAPIPGEVIEVAGGRAYAGPAVSASVESLQAGAVLLAGCVVEAGARVANAVVMPGERVPAGESVEHCIWFEGRAIAAPE